MIESIIVAGIICFTLLILAAIGAWAATIDVRRRIKLEDADLKMKQDLHEINMDHQRQLLALNLQQNLLALERGEKVDLPNNNNNITDLSKQRQQTKLKWE